MTSQQDTWQVPGEEAVHEHGACWVSVSCMLGGNGSSGYMAWQSTGWNGARMVLKTVLE